MSERILKIDTYTTYDDVIRLNGKVQIAEQGLEITIPENRSINLHNYEFKDQVISPRNGETLTVKVTPSWRHDSDLNSLSKLVIAGENPGEVLSLRVFVTCEKTKWSS